MKASVDEVYNKLLFLEKGVEGKITDLDLFLYA